MKIAITIFGSRVAPRFDTSQNLLVVSFFDGRDARREHVILEKESAYGKIREISELGITTLICGAIAQFELAYMVQNGIEPIPGVTGEAEDILDMLTKRQWLPQDLFWNQSFCGRKGWQWQKGCQFFRGDLNMPREDGTGPMGQGPGMGKGMGQGMGQGAGMGRRMGRLGAGPSGVCACSNCGSTLPHQRGIPCNQLTGPKCGNLMARGR